LTASLHAIDPKVFSVAKAHLLVGLTQFLQKVSHESDPLLPGFCNNKFAGSWTAAGAAAGHVTAAGHAGALGHEIPPTCCFKVATVFLAVAASVAAVVRVLP